jgi:hypothetical protein
VCLDPRQWHRTPAKLCHCPRRGSIHLNIDMGPNDSVLDSMTHQTKKKRVEDQPFPTDGGQRPIQLQRRRVWRACEGCRSVSFHFLPPDHTHAHNRLCSSRKKIKCDGNEPTCSQCGASGSQCTWLQTKDRAALSRQYVTLLWLHLSSRPSITHLP